jgi:hypothetical protein
MLAVILGGAGGAPAGAASPGAATTLPPPVPCPGCWVPPLRTEWQWQLSGTVDQSVNAAMYDIDMFNNTSQVVASLHAAGRKVICYIDAGTWESWRPDASQFPPAVLGNPVSGFPNERWLDIRQTSILSPIIIGGNPASPGRLDQCHAKGFDGVEFDNVDGYTNNSGFPLTAQDQLNYNTLLANAAHQRGLNVALKNDLDQIGTLLPYFDWVLDEQCFQYSECNKLVAFLRASKAVMEVEYYLQPGQFCPRANALNFNSMKKHLDLGAYRVACR